MNKMKRIIFLMCILTCYFACSNINSNTNNLKDTLTDSLRHEFIMQIVTDAHINSLYLAIPINGNTYIDTHLSLYHFLCNGHNLTPDEEVKLIEAMLDGKSDIVWDLNNSYANRIRLKDRIYEDVPIVSDVAKKGKEYFINYYFNEVGMLKDTGIHNVLHEGMEEKEIKAIIYYLFQWGVPCRYTCETGTLIIDYDYFNTHYSKRYAH